MVFLLACILMASIAGVGGFMWLRRPPVEWVWLDDLADQARFLSSLDQAIKEARK